MFQMSKEDIEEWKSQIVISNSTDIQGDRVLMSQSVISKPVERRGGTQKLPYAFTENGVAMLSSVLKSPLAIQKNIGIMRAFTEFRKIATGISLPSQSTDVAQLRKDFEFESNIFTDFREHLRGDAEE